MRTTCIITLGLLVTRSGDARGSSIARTVAAWGTSEAAAYDVRFVGTTSVPGLRAETVGRVDRRGDCLYADLTTTGSMNGVSLPGDVSRSVWISNGQNYFDVDYSRPGAVHWVVQYARSERAGPGAATQSKIADYAPQTLAPLDGKFESVAGHPLAEILADPSTMRERDDDSGLSARTKYGRIVCSYARDGSGLASRIEIHCGPDDLYLDSKLSEQKETNPAARIAEADFSLTDVRWSADGQGEYMSAGTWTSNFKFANGASWRVTREMSRKRLAAGELRTRWLPDVPVGTPVRRQGDASGVKYRWDGEQAVPMTNDAAFEAIANGAARLGESRPSEGEGWLRQMGWPVGLAAGLAAVLIGIAEWVRRRDGRRKGAAK